MDADISPTLKNNHMHTVQTRTKTFLSTISHFDKFGVKKKKNLAGHKKIYTWAS